ncbi:MAG TPA: glycogen/starch/alpha-glucan phosphorylase [Polyangia bacterium]|nr:glycogen/starch/alpha-glucan phosphorylase [Polyangia bacterium]
MNDTATERAPKRPTGGHNRVSMDPATFKRTVLDHLLYTCARDLSDATPRDLYQALAHTVRDRLVHRWLATQRTYDERDVKRAYYLSSEFLTGRSLGLCLLNLGIYDTAEALAAERGTDLETVLGQEGDPGLGNGGLGRLAACFMDSLATLGLPAVGYGIRYDFGIFEQRIEEGRQVEFHDNWLQDGNPWELPRMEEAQIVRLGGTTKLRHDPDGRLRVDWIPAHTILGVPYDSFIVGHKNSTVNTLRLWAARATRDFDLKFFNEGDYRRAVEEKIDSENISKVLYPNDQTDEGKALRLKQQYFFVACSIGDIMRRYKQRHRSFDLFPKRAAIQLNDTHPSIGIAELMRLLVDEEGLDWEPAWAITEQTFGYTNHTLLPEALERWSVPLLESLLPRHMQIIFEINQRFLRRVQTQWPGDMDRLARMSIIEEASPKQVRMAHLATVGSHSVNGVAQLHTDLVKRHLFADFDELWPDKINNKTNGVSPRRWMLYSNPRLTRLISSRIGTDWIDRDLRQLKQIERFADDRPFLEALHQVKQANKRDLAVLVGRKLSVELPPEAMFVAQIKRIHEYKRQLLACLQAIAHYLKLKREPDSDETPRVYLFSGKAAAGYTMAKLHIKLINDVAEVINSDPVVQGKLAMVFLPNYGVTLAQQIIPAADVSVQISTAGKEASGTSNMKFALNGALTLGTLDGANVEIREEVGPDNFFLFGLNVDQVVALRNQGYDPKPYIERSPALAEALALIESGFFSFGEPDRFQPILDGLRTWDPYMICADFEDFVATEARAAALFKDPIAWSRMALHNIAGASRFSSDETIRQYAADIWGLQPVPVDLKLVGGEG